jgi:hypothetical protein
MTVSSIDHGKKCKTAIILPCYNCGLHNFISFQRIKIDNYNCVQKAKCQICKLEWSEFWYMPEQSRSFSQQLSLSKRYKKISREDKPTMLLQRKIITIRIKRRIKAAQNTVRTLSRCYGRC